MTQVRVSRRMCEAKEMLERIVTPRQNSGNRRNQSKYGVEVVYMEARSHLDRLYVAKAYVNDKQRHIGVYATPKEAAQARTDYIKANSKEE